MKYSIFNQINEDTTQQISADSICGLPLKYYQTFDDWCNELIGNCIWVSNEKGMTFSLEKRGKDVAKLCSIYYWLKEKEIEYQNLFQLFLKIDTNQPLTYYISGTGQNSHLKKYDFNITADSLFGLIEKYNENYGYVYNSITFTDSYIIIPDYGRMPLNKRELNDIYQGVRTYNFLQWVEKQAVEKMRTYETEKQNI